MNYKLCECVYLKKDKYTFKEQLFLNNNNKIVYCLVADKSGDIECLYQSLNSFGNKTKDLIIKQYLDFKGDNNEKY